MKRYLLMFNGKAVEDFKQMKRAENAFRNRVNSCSPELDTVDLVDIRTGEILLTNEND